MATMIAVHRHPATTATTDLDMMIGVVTPTAEVPVTDLRHLVVTTTGTTVGLGGITRGTGARRGDATTIVMRGVETETETGMGPSATEGKLAALTRSLCSYH